MEATVTTAKPVYTLNSGALYYFSRYHRRLDFKAVSIAFAANIYLLENAKSFN